MCSVRHVPSHTAGIYRRYDRYRTLRIVGHQYLYQTRWYVRHDIDTDTPLRPVQPFVLVSDISVRSVQHQSRYEILRQIRYIIQYLYWTLRYRYGDLGADTGVATTYIPVPGSQVHSVSHRPDFGYFGTFGSASTRYRHIVTSSVQSLASTRPRTRTHQTARPNHIIAYCYRCYARYTEMLTTHKQQA